MNIAKHVALIAIVFSSISLVISGYGVIQRKAEPSISVSDPSIHIWIGKTEVGEEAVCINGFAYRDVDILGDRLLAPMTGVRADELGSDDSSRPARAVRCES